MRDQYYRANQIYTGPGKPGVLPIRRTHFYRLLKAGKFPEADAHIGNTRLWSAAAIHKAVMQVQDNGEDNPIS